MIEKVKYFSCIHISIFPGKSYLSNEYPFVHQRTSYEDILHLVLQREIFYAKLSQLPFLVTTQVSSQYSRGKSPCLQHAITWVGAAACLRPGSACQWV